MFRFFEFNMTLFWSVKSREIEDNSESDTMADENWKAELTEEGGKKGGRKDNPRPHQVVAPPPVRRVGGTGCWSSRSPIVVAA